jgi:LysM repeat protein
MNNQNPFVPEGSLLEQQSKRRSRLKLAVFCALAVGVAGLTAMLIQGCKREQADTTDNTPTADTNNIAADTNSSPAVDTNAPSPVVTNPPVVVAPPPVETAGTEYVVVKGDSFAKIAKKFGVKVKAIEEANPGIAPAKLKIGQKLSIPAAAAADTTAGSTATSAGASDDESIYVVKSGDTLTGIARHHGTTVKAIVSENTLSTMSIKVGQKLKIPAKAEASTPAPASVDTTSSVPTPSTPSVTAPPAH